jgi:hypothetical protein
MASSGETVLHWRRTGFTARTVSGAETDRFAAGGGRLRPTMDATGRARRLTADAISILRKMR